MEIIQVKDDIIQSKSFFEIVFRNFKIHRRIKIICASQDDYFKSFESYIKKTTDNLVDFNNVNDTKDLTNIIKEDIPDIVIIDLNISEFSAFNICWEIKNILSNQYIYLLVVLNTFDDENQKELAFKCGADDCIVRPFELHELFIKIIVGARVKFLQNQLVNDILTGLRNKNFFIQQLCLEFYRSIRYNRPLTCLLIDIDNLKNINYNSGEDTGDLVIKEITKDIRKIIRLIDAHSFSRWGGDEFIFLLPETDTGEAILCGEKIRKTIEDKDFTNLDKNIKRITISIGISERLQEMKLEKDLIDNAETALKLSKKAGNNKVTLFAHPLT